MSHQKLASIQRAITELHAFASPDNLDGLVLIQTDGNTVSVFAHPSRNWYSVEHFEPLGFEPLITCAGIYETRTNQGSLAHQIQEIESRTQYNAILEKAKSVLTDDEIQVLKQGR
jgi:nitrogenase molybdenum-iron protein alpha/beta subunit